LTGATGRDSDPKPPEAAVSDNDGSPSLPRELDRRCEAIVIWLTTPKAVPPELIELEEIGVPITVITPLSLDAPTPQLAWSTAVAAANWSTQDVEQIGVDDPVVDTDDDSVKLLPGDVNDVAFAVLQELWERGVDSRGVLFLIDDRSEVSQLLQSETLPDLISAPADAHRLSPPAGVLSVAGGSARLRRILADQLLRRRRGSLPDLGNLPGWSVVVDGVDAQYERVHEALLTLADGHVGITGAPVSPVSGRHPLVLAAGLYDGDGAESHLLTCPGVFKLAGSRASNDSSQQVQRVLDLRSGVLYERADLEVGTVQSVRFMSLAQPGAAVLRVRCPKGLRAGPPLQPPTEDPVHDEGRSGSSHWMRVAASSGGIVAAATQTRTRAASGGGALDRFAVYRADTEHLPDISGPVEDLERVSNNGFDRLLVQHRREWARRWEDTDVVVEGDDGLQVAIRFALFHLMGSVADTGEAAVGARGLTGTGYRGHVFWDADVFVLPFLAATHPSSARAMLEYRLRRLPAAIEAALEGGRSGARFPWESARSGRDVTPTSARNRSGRIVAIRTGGLEEHIVSQVAWAACCYTDWSGDREFAQGPGRRILTETARYWASRIRLEPDGSAHIFGVIGPDEYHESVDDNAFTNVMARWNLRRAAEDPADDLGVGEQSRWLELANALVDGYDPDTGVYEQFAGFNRLEPLIIEEVAPRRPIAADLLLGADRVARAQVLKQADVLLLHHLVPDEVVPGSLEPNLRFYEPRTAHASSLSPATHALVQARARDFDRALESLQLASRIDLDDLTGSTASGLHLATMGGLWQALAFGFAGIRPRDAALQVDPVLPPSWSVMETRVRFHGSRVRVRNERDQLILMTDRPTALMVGSRRFTSVSGKIEFRRRGSEWEPIT